MNRKIEFISTPTHLWKEVLIAIIIFTVFSTIISSAFDTERSLSTYATTVVVLTVVTMMGNRIRKSHLSVVDETVYLHQLAADLKYKQSLFGYSYIQVTSLTKSGYHRLKIKQNEIASDDWDYLFNRCS